MIQGGIKEEDNKKGGVNPKPAGFTYSDIEPYNSGFLSVSSKHEIYFEECGNPDGKPVVFLHGGPGSGCNPHHRRFFNPQKYRIILFDQRGCGRSKPHACLEENTTWDLVADIEKLRQHLGINKWQVFGGSWGSTLAVAYAEKHPSSVTEMVLRGIFLLRQKEISWFYQKGASAIFPELFEEYAKIIPKEERNDFVTAYYKRLTSDDPNVRLEAARAWSTWEGSVLRLLPDPQLVQMFSADQFAVAIARIECHYFVNKGFLPNDSYLLDNVSKIAHIPCVIVHGRYDVVCPVENAWELHKAWPSSKLIILPDCGHAATEPGIEQALVAATDKFAS